MSHRKRTLEEVMDEILSHDEESVLLLADDYDSESDFETDSDGRIDSNDSHDDSGSADSTDDEPVPVAAARGRGRARGRGARGGRGRARAPYVRPPSPPGWTADTTGFTELLIYTCTRPTDRVQMA
jgi:hypothetical protein